MPLFNDIDLGPSNPYKSPTAGMHTSVVEIPGGYAVPYGVDSTHPSWKVDFWFQAQSAVGQFAAGSQKAVEYLGRQLEELARNYDLQPCYVQLFAGTNLPVASWVQPQDGWYYISSCTIDYSRSLFGFARATISLEYVSPGAPRRVGVVQYGGALASTYIMTGVNWVAFPFNSQNLVGTLSRTGAEGVIPWARSPALNPTPTVLSSTFADWFKGGCRVYDAMGTLGANPVPAAPTVLNANWVEVKGCDHRFVGDVVITNGLRLYAIQFNTIPGSNSYVWNTALATPGWNSTGGIFYNENAGNNGTLRQFTLLRLGLEEVAVQLVYSTAAGNVAEVTLRLQRASWASRLELRPRTYANTTTVALALGGNPKIVYNPTAALDDPLQNPLGLAADTNYGWAAAFKNDATVPYVNGWLYQTPPAFQPNAFTAAQLGLGDTAGPAQNASTVYGEFAVPFGSVSGGTTVDKLQAEAESGTLAAGWTSQANAAASGGNEAKCASGTVTARDDVFGTAFLPPAGNYDCWMRVKVTSAAGNTSEMQLGYWDPTAASFVGSTTYKANQVTTSYAWYKVGSALLLPATHATRFRAVTTNTLGTDWFVDEAALVPTTSTTTYDFPQDIWQQFMYDRSTRLVVG